MPYQRDSRAIVTCPINSTGLARKELQLFSSFLYYFSLYLDRPSTGAEVGRYERFVFLFLALVCRAICFCLWVQ